MKRHLFLLLVFAAYCISVPAQKIAKPTLTPKPETEEQKALIMEGIKLHDQKQYDAAIKKYQLVLRENPDSTFALYELAMTQYEKGETEAAMETAVRGTKYKSNELALFYQIMGNAIDDVGRPNEAVKLYRDGIKFIEDDKEMARHVASLYYNLGVTYVRQKNYSDSRTALKKSVEYNPQYASPHFLLSEVFIGEKYKIPAVAAAARLISLEFNSPRTQRSAEIIRAVLAPAKKDDKGNINIFMDLNAPKDEGDFGMYDLFLGTLTVPKDDKEKAKTEEETFADGVSTLIALIEEDKKLSSTFIGKNYVPFLSEMKKLGHVRPFSYIVMFHGGNPLAEKWIAANGDSVMAFLKWANEYRLPVK